MNYKKSIIFLSALTIIIISMLGTVSATIDTSYLYGDIVTIVGGNTSCTEFGTQWIDIDDDDIDDIGIRCGACTSTHKEYMAYYLYIGSIPYGIDTTGYLVYSSDVLDDGIKSYMLGADVNISLLDINEYRINSPSSSCVTSGQMTTVFAINTSSGKYGYVEVITTKPAGYAVYGYATYTFYAQEDETEPVRFSAYDFEELYSIPVSGLVSIDASQANGYIYYVTNDSIARVDKITGLVNKINSDYTGIKNLVYDNYNDNVIVVSDMDAVLGVTSGDIIVLDATLTTVLSNTTIPELPYSTPIGVVTGVDIGKFTDDSYVDIFYSMCEDYNVGSLCGVYGYRYDYGIDSISLIFEYTENYEVGVSYLESIYGVAVGDTNIDDYAEVNFLYYINSLATSGLISIKVDDTYNILSETILGKDIYEPLVTYNNIDINNYFVSDDFDEIAFITSDSNFNLLYGGVYSGSMTLYWDDISAFGKSTMFGNIPELIIQSTDSLLIYRYTANDEDFPEKIAGVVTLPYVGLNTNLDGEYYILEPYTENQDMIFAGSEGFTVYSASKSDSYEVCVEDWYSSAWGYCTSGTQTRTVTDLNDCGTELNKPITEQSCDSTSYEPTTGVNGSLIGSGDLQTYELYTTCQPQYECSQWSDCVNTQKTQTCVDINICDEAIPKIYRRATCVESDNIYWAEEIHATILYVDSVLWAPFANMTMIVFAIALLMTIFYIFIDLFNFFHKKGGKM